MVGNIMMQHISFFWRIYYEGRRKKRRWVRGEKNVKNKKQTHRKGEDEGRIENVSVENLKGK
jgi:hypothetical protein